MPSPLAHIGLAWAFHIAVRPSGPVRLGREAAVVAFAAVAADLDVLADLASGGGIVYHHGATHSVLFALGLGALLSRRGPAVRWSAPFAAALHAPLDWTTGDAGAPVRYGVELFWPLSSQRYIAARPFFPPYHIDAAGGLWNMLAVDAVPAYAREGAVVAVALLGAWAIRGLRTRSRGPSAS